MTHKPTPRRSIYPAFLALLTAVVTQLQTTSLLSADGASTRGMRKTAAEWQTWADEHHLQIATFGAGCFWCTEAAFETLPGVEAAVSGYAGGNVPNPTYEQVSMKTTGHVEVCQIFYDPEKIRFTQLLDLFFKIHDPTSMDHQGPDHGPQYRSVIFYHSPTQQSEANEAIAALDKKLPLKVVTRVDPFTNFYMAEEYHQDFYAKNPKHGYCQAVVRAKVTKAKQFSRQKLDHDKSNKE